MPLVPRLPQVLYMRILVTKLHWQHVVTRDEGLAGQLRPFEALVTYPWAPPAVTRSLRGRPSQVKGA